MSNFTTNKTAIVTGASSGIGLAISRALLSQGIRVYGFGRTFPDELSGLADFIPIVCDFLDGGRLVHAAEEIRRRETVHILVNNAGTAYYGPHEELNPKKIHEMTCVNLEAPMILTQLFLRDLKKHHGTIINISSVTAMQSNTHGCAYGATKAGLTSFTRSLFNEVRKYGVRVALIHPDMTDTALYRHAGFRPGTAGDVRLLPQDIADAVLHILSLRDGLNITELTIRPQRHYIEKHLK